jgi:hypothetical protein
MAHTAGSGGTVFGKVVALKTISPWENQPSSIGQKPKAFQAAMPSVRRCFGIWMIPWQSQASLYDKVEQDRIGDEAEDVVL